MNVATHLVFLMVFLSVLVALGRRWSREHHVRMAEQRRLAALLADGAASAEAKAKVPEFSRDWQVRRMRDGSTVLMLAQVVDSYSADGDRRQRVAVAAIHLPPGEEADSAWGICLKQQSAVVEQALKDGLRVPVMSEAAPGAPRKERAR